MKKKRGLRRYFRSLKWKKLKIPLIWIKDGFFSYDKLWVDYYGFTGIKKRKPHLECLIRNFEAVSSQIPHHIPEFQMWIWINEYNGMEDCIILHAPNPFTAFPHKYEDISFESNFKNADLLNFIHQQSAFKKIFGTYLFENDHGLEVQENFCVLYKDNIGEPII